MKVRFGVLANQRHTPPRMFCTRSYLFIARSHSKLRQSRMIRRPRTGCSPEETPISRSDRYIIDAGFTPAHQSFLIEFPLFIAIGSVPGAGIIAPFILKSHCNPVLVKRPKLFDQPVVQLLRPFAAQKFDDRGAALEKFRTVSPSAVFRI